MATLANTYRLISLLAAGPYRASSFLDTPPLTYNGGPERNMTELEFKSLAAQGYNRIPLVHETFADLDTVVPGRSVFAEADDTGGVMDDRDGAGARRIIAPMRVPSCTHHNNSHPEILISTALSPCRIPRYIR